MTPAATTRLSADERRGRVLEAATRAFARTGYAATSTDAVAKEAGVSQPYVVRIFGTKLELFLEVFDVATRRVLDAFQAVIDAGEVDPTTEEPLEPLGQVYSELVREDRDIMQIMIHGFAAAGDAEIGRFARRRMSEIFEVARSAGADDEQVRAFLAQGMLINVMLAMGALENIDESPAIRSLAECILGDELATLLDAS